MGAQALQSQPLGHRDDQTVQVRALDSYRLAEPAPDEVKGHRKGHSTEIEACLHVGTDQPDPEGVELSSTLQQRAPEPVRVDRSSPVPVRQSR